jgi:outer membrane translocation and assembly module TamA
MGRLEIASGLPIARLSAFSDVGWAGAREDFTFEDPYVDVGLGWSLMDGIFRFDIARAVRRGSDWRIHFYLDGLF